MELVQPKNLDHDPKASRCTQADIRPSVVTFTFREMIQLCCFLNMENKKQCLSKVHISGRAAVMDLLPKEPMRLNGQINFMYTKRNGGLGRNI